MLQEKLLANCKYSRSRRFSEEIFYAAKRRNASAFGCLSSSEWEEQEGVQFEENVPQRVASDFG